MTALAASIGTGNIAGVATAIVSGGPGALFWIWCYGFVAMAIKFAEAVLGSHFRESRGAKGVLVRADVLPARRLEVAGARVDYALVAGVAALTTTPFTQPNSMARRPEQAVRHPDARLGHRDRGADVARDHRRHQIDRPRRGKAVAVEGRPLSGRRPDRHRLVRRRIPDVLALVFREAFSTRAAVGAVGSAWVALRYGLARGIYANEAGYGTAAVAYGTAASKRPVQQGLNAVMEVFIVSFVTSTISAMTLLLTGAWQSGTTELRRRGRRVQSGDAGRRRLDRRVLRVPVRLHDTHRLGVLRRAVPRIPPRPRASPCRTAGSIAC